MPVGCERCSQSARARSARHLFNWVDRKFSFSGDTPLHEVSAKLGREIPTEGGVVTVGGEKMAKSVGNFVTIRDALKRFPADALKLLLLSTNYRGPLDYTESAVMEKVKALQGLQEFLRGVEILRVEAGRSPRPASRSK